MFVTDLRYFQYYIGDRCVAQDVTYITMSPTLVLPDVTSKLPSQ